MPSYSLANWDGRLSSQGAAQSTSASVTDIGGNTSAHLTPGNNLARISDAPLDGSLGYYASEKHKSKGSQSFSHGVMSRDSDINQRTIAARGSASVSPAKVSPMASLTSGISPSLVKQDVIASIPPMSTLARFQATSPTRRQEIQYLQNGGTPARAGQDEGTQASTVTSDSVQVNSSTTQLEMKAFSKIQSSAPSSISGGNAPTQTTVLPNKIITTPVTDSFSDLDAPSCADAEGEDEDDDIIIVDEMSIHLFDPSQIQRQASTIESHIIDLTKDQTPPRQVFSISSSSPGSLIYPPSTSPPLREQFNLFTPTPSPPPQRQPARRRQKIFLSHIDVPPLPKGRKKTEYHRISRPAPRKPRPNRPVNVYQSISDALTAQINHNAEIGVMSPVSVKKPLPMKKRHKPPDEREGNAVAGPSSLRAPITWMNIKRKYTRKGSDDEDEARRARKRAKMAKENGCVDETKVRKRNIREEGLYASYDAKKDVVRLDVRKVPSATHDILAVNMRFMLAKLASGSHTQTKVPLKSRSNTWFPWPPMTPLLVEEESISAGGLIEDIGLKAERVNVIDVDKLEIVAQAEKEEKNEKRRVQKLERRQEKAHARTSPVKLQRSPSGLIIISDSDSEEVDVLDKLSRPSAKALGKRKEVSNPKRSPTKPMSSPISKLIHVSKPSLTTESEITQHLQKLSDPQTIHFIHNQVPSAMSPPAQSGSTSISVHERSQHHDGLPQSPSILTAPPSSVHAPPPQLSPQYRRPPLESPPKHHFFSNTQATSGLRSNAEDLFLIHPNSLIDNDRDIYDDVLNPLTFDGDSHMADGVNDYAWDGTIDPSLLGGFQPEEEEPEPQLPALQEEEEVSERNPISRVASPSPSPSSSSSSSSSSALPSVTKSMSLNTVSRLSSHYSEFSSLLPATRHRTRRIPADMIDIGDLDLGSAEISSDEDWDKPKLLSSKKIGPPVKKMTASNRGKGRRTRGDWPTSSISSFCHQCRGTSYLLKMRCACSKNYCVRCITTRYDESLTFDTSLQDFTCPACKNTCTCDICTRRRGEVYISLRKPSTTAKAAGPPTIMTTRAKKIPPKTQIKYPPLPLTQTIAGPVTYWATIYGISGEKLGTAFVGEDGNDDVVVALPIKPQRRVFIGAVPPSWGLGRLGRNPATRDLVPIPKPGKGKNKEKQRFYIGKKIIRRPRSKPDAPVVYYGDEPLSPLSPSVSVDDWGERRGGYDYESGLAPRVGTPLNLSANTTLMKTQSPLQSSEHSYLWAL